MKVSNRIVIRKAKKVDAQEIWNIRNAAIKSQCIGHYSSAELEIWTNGEVTEQFVGVVEDSFYVATLDGQNSFIPRLKFHPGVSSELRGAGTA